MKNNLLLLILFSLLGILYKLWFITLAPQPVIWDQNEYINYAHEILNKGITGTTSRTYVYPLFLAVHFYLSGSDNYQLIYVSQAILDTFSGLLLYFLAKRLFQSERIAFMALLFQLFNPFTSAYVGVLLSEIVASFLIVLSVFLFYFGFGKNKFKPLNVLLLGITLGLLTETRPMYFWWCIGVLLCTPLLFKLKRTMISVLTVMGLGFGLAVSYQVISNMTLFRQFSIVSVDQQFAREFYDGAILHVAPLFPNQSESYPIEMRIMFSEYSTVPSNAQERKQMAEKYFKKAIDYIRKDPVDYIKWRFIKMWSMWQKPNVFFYHEPGFDQHWVITYLVNLVLLVCAVFGMIKSFLIGDVQSKSSTGFMISLLLYMTFALAFSHAEPRLTIPAYPVIFIFAVYGLNHLGRIVSKIRIRFV